MQPIHRRGLQEEKATALWRALYHKTGIPLPEDERAYGTPFRVGYGGSGVEIKSPEGVDALLKLLAQHSMQFNWSSGNTPLGQ